MPSIDLPRALRDYFAFAETTPTRNGRRFSITLPYLRADGRLDRLQWWYHVSAAREQLCESVCETARTEAVARFQSHIEQWLRNTGQVLYGPGAIPALAIEGQRVAHREFAPALEPPASPLAAADVGAQEPIPSPAAQAAAR